MIILDTNVISELIRPQPEAQVVAWIDSQYQTQLYLTSVSLAETLCGIERLPLGRRRRELVVYFGIVLDARFQSRILGFDEESARTYAIVAAEREAIGRRMGMADAQIAAICRKHEATLATRNVRDFEETGVRLINPWEA